MSVINLIFGTRAAQSAQLYSVDTLATFEMDVTISEDHQRSAVVTENPVEDGSVVSDQVILDPERVIVEGFVTSAPARILPLGAIGEGGIQRVINAFDLLDDLWRARNPLMLTTGYRVYRDMVINRVSMPRGREIGLRFSVELQNVNRVAGEVGTVNVSQAVADAAARTLDAGRQATQEPSAATSERTGSLLFRIGEGARGLGQVVAQ